MRIYRAIPLLLAFGLLVSCGLNNTMYNARKYFRSAQQRPLNTNGRPSPQAVEDYTKAIKKCGIIITNYKGSPLMDDALFLMAKSLYLKGNSAFQAKDQFQALITGFPDSPFVTEAYVYLAKVMREINMPADASKLLEDFVRDPKYRRDHPRALLTLAEFRIADKDYLGAQFWLGKIINEYPKTREYTEAFFLFGKNYYVQKEYTASLMEFEKLVGAKGTDKLLKMEARYYMALNQLELGAYDKATRLVQGLLNDESRPEKLGPVRVLKVRLLFATGKYEDAVAEVDAISKAYPRTASSAEAYYHLGNYHFYVRNNIGDASTAYNKVRTEFQTSELVAPTQQKLNALNQLKMNQNLSVVDNLQQYLDYHTQAAENYFNLLALPDSALVMYDRLINAPVSIRAQRDSLEAALAVQSARLDSLEEFISTFKDSIALADTTQAEEVSTMEEPAAEDTLLAEEDKKPEDDAKPELAASEERDRLSNDRENIRARLDKLNDVLTRFDNEVLPFAYFARASLLHRKSESAEADTIYTLMQQSYPQSKYTNALRALKAGEAIRLTDPEEDRQEALLERAFGMYPAQPDSMRAILEELTGSRFSGVSLKANFRLGWFHSYEVRDTTLAKPYLDKVLKDAPTSEQANLINRFYDGTKYKVFTSLQEPAPAEQDSLDSSGEGEKDVPIPGDDTSEPEPVDNPDTGDIDAENAPSTALEEPSIPLPTDPEVVPPLPDSTPTANPPELPHGGSKIE